MINVQDFFWKMGEGEGCLYNFERVNLKRAQLRREIFFMAGIELRVIILTVNSLVSCNSCYHMGFTMTYLLSVILLDVQVQNFYRL